MDKSNQWMPDQTPHYSLQPKPLKSKVTKPTRSVLWFGKLARVPRINPYKLVDCPILPGEAEYTVSVVIYPTIPIFSPPLSITRERFIFPCSLGSSLISRFASTTGTVSLLIKGSNPSTPKSNSWLPRH